MRIAGAESCLTSVRADVGATWRRSAGRPSSRRLLPPAVHHAPSASCAPGSPSRPPRAGCAVEADGFGNLVAWWDAGGRPASVGLAGRSRRGLSGRRLTGSHLDSVLDGGAYDGPLGVVSALAAVDLLRERGFVPGPADRGRGVRRGGGLAVRAGLPGLAAGHRRDRPGSRPASCATGTASPRRRDGRRRARRRIAGPGWTRSTRRRASSSCTSSRAATSSTAATRSGWPADLAARALPLRAVISRTSFLTDQPFSRDVAAR